VYCLDRDGGGWGLLFACNEALGHTRIGWKDGSPIEVYHRYIESDVTFSNRRSKCQWTDLLHVDGPSES